MNSDRIYLLLLIALPCIYSIAIGLGHVREIEEKHARFAQPGQQQPAWELQGARLDELTIEREQLDEWTARVEDRLHRADGSTPLILDVSSRLRSIGLESEKIDNLPAVERAFHNSERVMLVVSGAFVSLFRFIVEIEAASPPSRVTTISVRTQPTDGKVIANLTIERFWRPGP